MEENQHSINIRQNKNVFFTIYDSTVPAGTGFGVYFRGTGYEVHNVKEIFTGLHSHYSRTKSKARAVAKFISKFPRRVYKLVPAQVWVNGDSKIEGEPIDIRTELDLVGLIRLFNKD